MATDNIGPRIELDGEKEFKKSLSSVDAQLKALAAETKALSAEFAANATSEEALSAKNEVLGRSTQAVQTKMDLLSGQLGRQKEVLAQLGAELDEVIQKEGQSSKDASKAQNAYNDQAAAVAKLEAQYQSARAQLAKLNNEMAGVEDVSDQAGQSLASDVLAGNAAWDALKVSVRAVSDALGDAVQAGMDFDASMSDVAATMGKSADSLGELRGFALEMGASTVFSATQAADALNYMALAGYDAETSMQMLPSVLNLAAAGGLELASASDMVTDAQSALGLSLEQTNLLVDQMAMTSTKTNTSVGKLGEAILTVGGTAKFLAGGTAELNQVLGVLADNSKKGADGGTKLRNVILSLSSPTEKAAATLEELGVSVFDAEGNMRQFSEIFPELNRALSSFTSQQQIDALNQIFNKEDLAAAQALLGTTAERWDQLAASIAGAQGSAQRMANTRLDNLAGDITLLKSATEGARIALSDSLTPALRDVTQTATGVLTVAGNIATEFPIVGQAAAGLAAGLGTLTLGFAATKAAAALAGGSITALGAQIMASPVAPFALAIGAGVTALSALSYAADNAGKKTTEAAQAVAESTAAFEEQRTAAETQRQDIENLTGQLEELAGTENRTAGQKAQLLAVTEQLNKAIPGLNLEYNELTDTLSMTTEQVLALARAQADAQERMDLAAHVVEMENLQRDAARELAIAEENLKNASAAVTQAERDGLNQSTATIEQFYEMRQAVKQAEKTVAELKQAYADSTDQLEDARARLQELSEAAEDAGEGMEDAADGTDTASRSFSELADVSEESKAAVEALTGAADTLTDALKEQKDAGTLSLDTANQLIDAGYASAIAIDEETGAVTLNRDEYIRLAKAKMEDQMASLETQRASIQAKETILQENLAAQDATRGYYNLAQAKTLAAYSDDRQALELQIAALKQAMSALDSYGTSSGKTARRTSAAAKKVKTQAEQDLAAYKAMKAELDHEKAMDLVSEAEYYNRLTALRNQYLTDAANVEEYRKVSESIYKADQEAMEKRRKLWEDTGSNILKLEEDFQNRLSVRASEIVNSYKLFEAVPEYQVTSAEALTKNLDAQISAIEGFYNNLAELQARGAPQAMVDEIRSMGVSASGELQGLVNATDEQLSKYVEAYETKQALANQIAEEELKDLRSQTNEAIMGQLGDVAKLYETNAPDLGKQFAQELAAGMFEGMPAVEAMAQTVANAAMSAFSAAYNRDVEALMAEPRQSITAGDIGELLAGAVNGINTGAGVSYPSVDVTLTMDGDVLARRQVDPMRRAFREKPETLDDKA